MKQFFTFLILLLLIQLNLMSQCYNCNTNYPSSIQSISSGQTIIVSTCVYGGEYSYYNVTSGITYTWNTCGDTDFDTQLTLFQGSTCGSGVVLAYNDDNCGTQSSITWTATFTGIVTLLVSKYNCLNQSSCMTLNWSASGGGGGGGSGGGGDLCSNARPFCSDSTYNFPAGVNSGTAEIGPNYCCLGSQPNPVWYYLRVDQPGNIELYIHSNPQRDLDFVCWGPFTNIYDPCIYPTTYLTNNGSCYTHHASGPGGGFPTGNTIDCSYSSSWEEWCYIPNAQVGQFYILLITNYSNQSCNIIFEQISGTGRTDCNIVICDMSSITATPSSCNSSTNYYSVSGSITVTDPPTSGQLIITDNSGATLTINPPFISPITYTINNINSDGTTHTITAQFTNSPSCNATITYNAPSACNICNPNAGPDKTVCGLTTNLEAVVNADNATYQWSPTAGISFSNINSPTTSITATAPGVYTLTWNVTSTYGVTCTDQVVITFDNPVVTATASPTSVCTGGSSTISASGASTYSWSHSLGTGSNKTVTPSATTTYTVTGTSAAGCTGTTTVSVTVNPLPTVTALASPTSICNGETSVLTASGANTYSWSHSLGTGTSKTVTPSATTTYTVTGTSAAGCTGTTTVSVTVNPLPTVTATASPTSVCPGGSSTINASGANTYSWSHSLGTGTIKTVTPSATTTYTVTGTSAAGCTGTTTVSVTVNPLPTVTATASPTSVCTGGSSTISASGASTYSWSGGLGTGASKTVTPSATTTYSVTGTSAAGCTGTATVSVTVNSIPTVTAAATPTSICIGSSSVLTAGGASTYSWSGGLGTGASKTVTPSATTTYSVTGTSAAGCTGTATVSVTVNPLPTVTASASPTSICNGETSVLTASGANTYSWSHSLGTGGSKTVTPSATTTYTVTGTSAAGCTGTTTVSVTVNPLPTVTASASPTSICNGETSVLTTSGASTYSWSHSLGTGASKTVTPSATTTYTVTGTSTEGCTATTTVNVMVNPLPTVSIESSQSSICIGSSTMLTANSDIPGTSFVWSNNFSGNNITVTPTSNTTYNVTGTTADGCTGTTFITIEVTQPPIVNYTTVQSHCGQSNGSIVINVNGGVPPYTYQWSNGATSGNLNNVSAGSYNLTVTDANGCKTFVNATITDAPGPQAIFAPKPQITTIDEPVIYFENFSTNANSFYWDFGDGYNSTDFSPIHTYLYSGEYHVILSVFDQYGCTDTVGANIIIKEINTYYIPNAFTPNGNDLNEKFNLIGSGINPNTFEMRIFDRWGKQIFYTRDINEGWDGTYNGKIVQQGMYTYMIKFEDSQGYRKHVVTGEVVIIK